MKVLVTGGAGFIGSHVVDRLLREGYRVVAVDDLSTGRREQVDRRATFYHLDVAGEELGAVMERERPDYVIHQAAQARAGQALADPVQDGRVNILGTVNLLQACARLGVRKVVYASSAAVYGEPRYLPLDEGHDRCPSSFYGISKLAGEMYVRAFWELHGLPYTILRYSNVYGPRQDALGEGGVVAIFIHRLLRGERPVVHGDGEQTRDFVYVEDVAEANLLALSRGDGQVVNISTGKACSVNRLLAMLNEVVKEETVEGPDPVHGPPRPGDIVHSCLDNRLAVKVLGWRPLHGLGDGLRKTVEFYLGGG